MSDFSRLTLSATAEILAQNLDQAQVDLLAFEWGVVQYMASDVSRLKKFTFLVRFIFEQKDQEVETGHGKVPLSLAMVNKAIEVGSPVSNGPTWDKFSAALKYDGFSIEEIEPEELVNPWEQTSLKSHFELRRMISKNIPGFDPKFIEDEITSLLKKHSLSTALGHLDQAVMNYRNGNWSSSNSQIRTLFEEVVRHITAFHESKEYRSGKLNDNLKTLGEDFGNEPFLSIGYYEYNKTEAKPQFMRGIVGRLNSEGPHPGLSSEEETTFRFQMMLVILRLLLRRYDAQKAKA